MTTKTNYPQYAAIESHIRRANLWHAVGIAEGISQFIVDWLDTIHEPPRRAAVIINGRFPGAGVEGRLATTR